MPKILILTKDLTNEEIVLAKQAMAKVKLLLPQMEFFYQTTNAKFNSITSGGSDLSVAGYVLDASQILPLVSGDFDIACLLYDATLLNPQPTNPASSLIKKGNTIPFAISKQWYNGYGEVLQEYFLHEYCHCEYFRNGQPDLTHKKYDVIWSNKFSQKSNIDYYLYLLKGMAPNIPPVKPQNAPTVVLTRKWSNTAQTYGDLEIGDFKAKTLEKPWLNNQRNISCIPLGEYKCVWSFSWKFLKYTYEVLNVPNRTGIRIHAGNTFYDIKGCIILGDRYGDVNKDKFADLLNSKITVDKFNSLLNKKDFILRVV